MFATLALAAAVLFIVLSLARLRGSPLKVLVAGVLLAASLAAVFALLHWSATQDSRWMVGAVLMIGALGLSLILGKRAVAIAAIVLGLLGATLFGVATARPMERPAHVA